MQPPEQPTPAPPPRWAPWAVVALAAALRVGWAAAVPVEPVSDGVVYDLFARNLASGVGYAFEPGRPTAYWPVGTSAAYAALYAAFGPRFGPVVALNIAIGTAAVALTMAMAGAWFGRRAGLAAGLLMALWPGQIQFVTTLNSELPFATCYLLGLYAATRARPGPMARSALAGAALAAASYVRPLALPMPAVFAWIRLVGPGGPPLRSRSAVRIVAEAAATMVVMLALILPWTARNARVFGRPVLVSANGGANLWMGNNPETSGDYMALPDYVRGMDEASRDALLKEEAVRYIRERPAAFVARTLVKVARTHDRETIGVAWNRPALERSLGPRVLTPMKLISSGYWYAMLALALAGAAIALRRLGPVRWLGQPAVALWAYFAALHGIVVSGDRYHYPSVPPMAALAGLAVVALLDLRVRSRPPRIAK